MDTTAQPMSRSPKMDKNTAIPSNTMDYAMEHTYPKISPSSTLPTTEQRCNTYLTPLHAKTLDVLKRETCSKPLRIMTKANIRK